MFTLKQVIEATKAKPLKSYDADYKIGQVSIDSRDIFAGQLFIAVKGANFDGHDFIFDVFAKQASAVICCSGWADRNKQALEKISKPVLIAEDTVFALNMLAKFHRNRFRIPVIAVTGSNGKTTTKNMIASVLKKDYNVLKSKASFNNNIGVPLTLLELNDSHTAAVIEMGMNHKGEIRGLALTAAPNIAVITNAATAHIEHLGSEENIVDAKCELLENLADDSVAVINADSKMLYNRVKNFPINIVDFAVNKPAAYQASNVVNDNKGIAFALNQKYTFRLGLIGEHNVYNALASIAVARQLKVDYGIIREELNSFSAADMRMQIINCAGLNIIADCYNANPDSVEAAVKTLSGMKTNGKKLFVFADMLELGKFSKQAHQQIGELIGQSNIDKFITVGKLAKYSAYSAKEYPFLKQNVFECDNDLQAAELLEEITEQGDTVLLKGSRAMRLEKIIDFLNNKCKQ